MMMERLRGSEAPVCSTLALIIVFRLGIFFLDSVEEIKKDMGSTLSYAIVMSQRASNPERRDSREYELGGLAVTLPAVGPASPT